MGLVSSMASESVGFSECFAFWPRENWDESLILPLSTTLIFFLLLIQHLRIEMYHLLSRIGIWESKKIVSRVLDPRIWLAPWKSSLYHHNRAKWISGSGRSGKKRAKKTPRIKSIKTFSWKTQKWFWRTSLSTLHKTDFGMDLAHWKCWLLRRGETRVPGEKPLGARTRTNNKLNPRVVAATQ